MRDLFKKGDRVRYIVGKNYNTWYDPNLTMIVMEDELDWIYSGVYVSVDHVKFFTGEDMIIYKWYGDTIGKGTIDFNYDLIDGIYDVKPVGSEIRIRITINDIIGYKIKDYILEIDEEYYIRKNRKDFICDLLK